MRTRIISTTLLTGILLWSCHQGRPAGEVEAWQDEQEYQTAVKFQAKIRAEAYAAVETDPVPRSAATDAADDPAIWVHPTNPSRSVIFGTDKEGGLGAYDLKGRLIRYYALGKLNNVDVRYNFSLGGKTYDLLAASNRTHNSLLVLLIDTATGSLETLAGNEIHIDTSTIDDVYGLCLYHPTSSGRFFAFINGKNGIIRQYEILAGDSANSMALLPVRSFSLPSQPEGMVADDEMGALYIGEEGKGIWKFPASPDSEPNGTVIPNTGSDNPDIRFDIEGLALYCGSLGKGYLVASSQGSFSYAVFSREDNNRYYGSFKISGQGGIDGAEETDGLDVINLPLGRDFPDGLLVVQDGFNHDGDSLVPQNFKLVRWGDVDAALQLPLGMDTIYDGWMSR